jgi:IS5 family transposase
MQNWFGYSDPTMEEALYETTILRQFAGLSLERIPDETTILNFRRLLEKYELAAGILGVINGYLGDRGLSLRQGTIVDATLIHAPSSTKNQDGKRDPEMHQAKKGNQWYFGMKAHIGVDDESGLVHSVVGTAANVADVTQVDSCCTATKTWSVPMPVIPEWRNAPSMKVARSSGRLPPGAAPSRNWASAASCTKSSARSKKPRRR